MTLLKPLIEKKIDGSIVEMGCWKGGCGAFMAKYANNRPVWLFDSFEGLPEVSPKDIRQAKIKNLEIKKGDKIQSTGKMTSSIDDAYLALKKMNSKANVIKGWFQEVLPKSKEKIGKISLLRLDADIYESTKYCLDELYDLVVEGGYIIIDDYRNWEGCRTALYEFFIDRNISPRIEYYPFGGRAYFIKNELGRI